MVMRFSQGMVRNRPAIAPPEAVLEGATEVFGGRAAYILANPNGITCNGCGFIGTPRATLTTGTPELDPANGALTGLSVDDGAISIGALGLDARGVDYFDVISRSVAINGAIHGKDVSVITGRNDIDYANRVVKAVKADDGSAKPEFSIDSSALGGMYANRISLEGTEAGVGVRTPENMAAGAGGMVLTADGRLVMRKASSKGAIRARSKSAGIEVWNDVHAASDLSLTSKASTSFLNHVIAGARGNVEIVSGQDVELAGALTGAGMNADGSFAAAEGTLSVTAAGNITVATDNTVNAGSTLDFSAGNFLNVNGTIHAYDSITLGSGLTFETAEGSKISTQAGYVSLAAATWLHNGELRSGLDTIIDFDGDIVNNGKIGSGRDTLLTVSGAFSNAGSISANRNTVLNLASAASNNGIIGAKQDVTLALSSDFTNTDTVLAAENLTIHGATASERAGTVTNDLGQMEAIAGDVSILATSFVNQGSEPSVTTTTTSSRTMTACNWNGGSICDQFETIITVVTETLDQDGEAAKLFAGGDISIDAATIENLYSEIASNGNVSLTGDTLLNQGREIVETTTNARKRWRYKKKSGKKTLRDVRDDGATISSVTLDSIPATIAAGGAFEGTFTDRIDNESIRENGDQVGLSSGDAIPQTSDLPPVFQPPSSSLTITNPAPEAKFLFETRAEFVDLSRFYNSDLFLAQLPAFAPEVTQKRLGDAYVESTMIREQLLKQTGRRTLEGTASDFESVKQLYNNAVAAQADLQLTPGIALTVDQIAALTTDIVWLEETIVNGEKVLAPRLYLAPGNRSTIQLAGARITGGSIKLSSDEINNEGALTAVASLDIEAETNLTNRGGSITATDVTLSANETVANLSGVISGETVAVTARNIRNETLVRSGEYVGGTTQTNQQRASITASETLSLEADEDIVSIGANIGSEGDASLKAGRDVRLETLETVTAFNMNLGDSVNSLDETKHQSSNLVVGGNLSVDAGRDLTISGSNVSAEGAADLSAGGDVNILSVKNQRREEIRYESGGDLRHQIWDNSSVVGSSVDAGGNLTITSGANVNVRASNVVAGEDLSVTAAEGLSVTGDTAENSNFYDSRSSGFMRKSSTLTQDASTSQTASLLMSGGDLTLKAGDDLTVKGSSVIGGNDALLEGQNVQLEADQVSSSFSDERKKSGFFAEAASGGLGVTAGYRKTEDDYKSAATTNITSAVSAGNDLTIRATKDITSEAAILSAGNDLKLEAGGDVVLDSVSDLASSSEKHKLDQVAVTVSAFENISGPVKTLIDTPRAVTSGTGNGAAVAISAGSGALRAVDAVNSLNALRSGGTIAGVKIGVGVTSERSEDSQSSSQAIGSSVSAGNDLTIEAGRDITASGARIDAGNDITLQAGRDVTLESAQSGMESEGSNSSMSAGIGVTLGVGLGGANASVGFEASGQNGSYEYKETTQVNTTVTAGGNLDIDAGRDLTLSGARAEADTADINVGRNLTVESRLDTAEGSNKSAGFNVGVSVGVSLGGAPGVGSFSASAGVNGSKGEQSKAWVNEASGIVTDGKLDVDVGEKTTVVGGVIASRSGELTLDTETLETQDIALQETSTQVSGGINVSVGTSFGTDENSGSSGKNRDAEGAFKPGVSVEGSYHNAEKEGIAHATIGEGDITVRDGDGDGVKADDLLADADAAEAAGDVDQAEALRAEADAEAAEDTTTTETQLANLNRDPDAVIEVTSEKEVGFEVYATDTALSEIAKLGKPIIESIQQQLQKSHELDEETSAAVDDIFKDLSDGTVSLSELAACANRQGFNLFDLIISPAYADGACSRYSTDAVRICVDFIDDMREGLVEAGANTLAQFNRRLVEDPEGFQDLMKIINNMPTSLALGPLEEEFRQAIMENPDDVQQVQNFVSGIIQRQIAAVEDGTLSPEAATIVALSGVALIAKLAPKKLRAKLVAAASKPVEKLLSAAQKSLWKSRGYSDNQIATAQRLGIKPKHVNKDGSVSNSAILEKLPRFITRADGQALDRNSITIPGPTNSPYGKMDYLLGKVPGSPESAGKGGYFGAELGFRSNEELANAMRSHLETNFGTAIITGHKIEVTAPLVGPNGAMRNVKAAWMLKSDGSVSFVTAFPGPKL
ncbi:hypothetical protein FMN50_08435 [Rhodobacterales bacterium]|nr:hypothetical protein FMN50_08435 [Rhodobacterales bacterium]